MTEFFQILIYNIKHFVLNFYLFIPFLSAILICLFMNNPINIRRISKLFFSSSLFLCCGLMLVLNYDSYDFFGNTLVFSKLSLTLSLFLNFIFMIFMFLSKTVIHKNHKAFYTLVLGCYSLINLFIFTDNLLILFILLFWLFFSQYFLAYNFSYSKEAKTSLKINLSIDFIVCLAAMSLIGYDFLRYFAINNIDFTFQNILNNLALIDKNSTLVAFGGIMVIIFNLIKLLPFDGNNLNNVSKINPLCISINTISNLILASILSLKTYIVFKDLFYISQDIIIAYLLINLLYYAILSYRQNNFTKFSLCTIKISFISGFFVLFCSSNSAIGSFIYYICSVLISFCLLFCVGTILFSKFKTGKISSLLKGVSKNRLFSSFIFIALFNLAKAPFLPLFTACLYCLCLIFTNQYDTFITEIMPYCLLFGLFTVSLSVFDLIYRIFIKTNKQNTKNPVLLRCEVVAILFIIFMLIIINIYPNYFTDTALNIENLGI